MQLGTTVIRKVKEIDIWRITVKSADDQTIHAIFNYNKKRHLLKKDYGENKQVCTAQNWHPTMVLGQQGQLKQDVNLADLGCPMQDPNQFPDGQWGSNLGDIGCVVGSSKMPRFLTLPLSSFLTAVLQLRATKQMSRSKFAQCAMAKADKWMASGQVRERLLDDAANGADDKK